MPFEELTAVSSIDGRYRKQTAELAAYFSEYTLMKKRITVECKYLIALSEYRVPGLRRFTDAEKAFLLGLIDLSLEDARLIKKIEVEGDGDTPATRHDVKAIEYFLKRKIAGTSLEDVSEWVHFALTSEDVNSVAYGFCLRSSLEFYMLPRIRELQAILDKLARAHAATPMLARTHGQSASPTTFGKEMRVFEKRLAREIERLEKYRVLVKWGGATGNYNAHVVALPSVDWPQFAKRFVKRLNDGHAQLIELNEFTTQIEPHDTYAELFDALRRINTILIDLSQDMWRYISDGWITQKPKAGEIGSSAMPHKVNPIDFENAEGNFGVANALFEHFSRKLPISRLQRDLSDSTVERVFGIAFAHTAIGYASLERGFGKIEVNARAMLDALRQHPEVIAEALQTALRCEGVPVPYEKLKELTRGRTVTMKDFAQFIDSLDIEPKVKRRLKALRPETYLGLASKIARSS